MPATPGPIPPPLSPDVPSESPLVAKWHASAEPPFLELRRGVRQVRIPFTALRCERFQPGIGSGSISIPLVYMANRRVSLADLDVVSSSGTGTLPGGHDPSLAGKEASGFCWRDAREICLEVERALGPTGARVRLPWQWEWQAAATECGQGRIPDLIGPRGEWTGDAWSKQARELVILANPGDPSGVEPRVYRGKWNRFDKEYALANSYQADPGEPREDCSFRFCVEPGGDSVEAAPGDAQNPP